MSIQPQVILVDNLKVRKINLQIGDNVIGNDANSVEESESLLEQAVKISLSDNGEMSITPYEGISCYLRSCGSHRWILLKPNDTEPLRLRDTCLLCPIKIWFRVISAMEVVSENSKRKMEEIMEDEPPDKKCCSEYNTEVECLNGFNNNSKELNVNDCIDNDDKFDKCENVTDKCENNMDECESNDITDVLQELDSQLDQPTVSSMDAEIEKSEDCIEPNADEQNKESTNVPCSDDNENTSEVQSNTDQGDGDQIKNSNLNENQQKNSDTAISTSNQDNNATTVNVPTVPREKCKYGSQCYRINAEHKAKYSHVGDADYDIPDNRPECPYGLSCYRINPVHKQNYKHTRSKRQAAINSVNNDEDSDSDQSIQESVDESDYDPSFIDDDDIESLEEFESDFEENNDDD